MKGSKGANAGQIEKKNEEGTKGVMQGCKAR